MRRGFTLIELAVVLVVVGLMVAFGLTAFGGSNDGKCYEKTEAQLQTIDSALKQFIATHGRLPKPAYADKGSSSPQFGYEASDGPDADSAPDASNDAAYATMVPAGIVNTGTVLIGALPHVTLNLPNEMASDCWGSKFTYAVTNALTSNNGSVGFPSNTVGAIVLNGGTLGTPQPLSAIISYVVVSHGSDKYGATPIAATDSTPRDCNGSSEPKIDRENCNHDATFFNSVRNTGTAGNYFDDVVVFSSKIQSREPCAVQPQTWLTNCSGNSALLMHGASGAISNTAAGFTGTVTVNCNDGTLSQSSPSCIPSAPSCASEGLNEGEGNYDGACNLTSCCGGAIIYQTLSSPCPAAPYNNGGGHCPAGCDNDPGDGLTGGQKYCSGVVVNEGVGNYVCFNGVWGASYPFNCNASHASQCQSGAVHSSFSSDTSGCSPPPNCGSGDTLPVMNCSETAQCICN